MVFLKLLTSTMKVFPKGVDVTDVFKEIESVLKKEMDYIREAKIVEEYTQKLNDDFFYVPKIHKDFCTDKVLCFEKIEGSPLSDINKLNISQANKNQLGEKIFELFLREIFEFKMVQTDAHGGNYYVDTTGEKLILLDFGACLKFEDDLILFYQNFFKYSFMQEREKFFETLRNFMSVSGKYLEFEEDQLWDYIKLVSEPLRSKSYDWKHTDIHNVLFEEGKKLRSSLKFKSVPAQFIFLDRKVLGVFTLLRMIGATVNMKRVFDKVVIESVAD
jgi:predicted unusual protein kinase regulating ubiquinone biosynthesis (AarF/ABC1/UbiB family)